ncbi:site-specific integrase [Candidatus Aalborgicola defluviihabitans]|uniref:site-specific integrase n=1 Tax=Candidatus Aalborgicola defluviihabitans TaxID=3386187 RepID=UPI0039B95C12
MARHYHRSPDLLSPPEIEAYLLHLVKDRKLSYSSVNHAASASRFLFETVLGRASGIVHLRPPMARVPQSIRSCSRARGSRTCLPAARIRFTEPCCKPSMRPVCVSPKPAHCAWMTSTARQIACACGLRPAKAVPTATASSAPAC